ncbi:glycosyltransferase [Kitasatospora misakiensis]|uniref:Glycosyltransferase n=1 Tax=Kitasatospora misakiensis TaxID=67330 RepID=A0ABW0XB24_9ACTN
MRVLIITAGSRGDVAPYTGLGRRLQEAGHEVVVAAHPAFEALIGGCGLGFRAVPGDPQALIRDWARAGSREEIQALTRAYADGLADGVAQAVGGGVDVLLTAFGPASLARVAGEALGIPVIGTYLVPSVPTGEFALPSARGDLDGPEGRLAAGQDVVRRAEGVFSGAASRLRSHFGLPVEAPSASSDVRPVFHGFSPSVLPRPDDWPSWVGAAGYWWPARPDGWQPPADLVDFLRAGPPPVFIGFGSMAVGEGERLSELVAGAVKRAGVRAVLQAGWADLGGFGGSGDVLAVGDVPHDWLFPRTAAVVHHAGAGTTAAALRAGVPAVPVPVMADQPFWAARLCELGVAPRSLPFQDLTAEALGAAISDSLADPSYRHRATELAHAIATEDGAAAVLAHLDSGLAEA